VTPNPGLLPLLAERDPDAPLAWRAGVPLSTRRLLFDVFVPAMQKPKGLARLTDIVERWIARTRDVESQTGCLYMAGAFEYDDREGELRELLLACVRPAGGAVPSVPPIDDPLRILPELLAFVLRGLGAPDRLVRCTLERVLSPAGAPAASASARA